MTSMNAEPDADGWANRMRAQVANGSIDLGRFSASEADYLREVSSAEPASTSVPRDDVPRQLVVSSLVAHGAFVAERTSGNVLQVRASDRTAIILEMLRRAEDVILVVDSDPAVPVRIAYSTSDLALDWAVEDDGSIQLGAWLVDALCVDWSRKATMGHLPDRELSTTAWSGPLSELISRSQRTTSFVSTRDGEDGAALIVCIDGNNSCWLARAWPADSGEIECEARQVDASELPSDLRALLMPA